MPVALNFGAGSVGALGEHLGEDRAVLLVYEQAAAFGLVDRLHAVLGDRITAVVECPDSMGTLSWARALSGDVWRSLAARPRSVLIAVGGGTVMDMAKLLRCRPLDGDFQTLAAALRRKAPWPPQRVERLWLVPTTAGTGSEVTRWATVWDTEQAVAQKRSLDEPFGYAERAIVDPELASTCTPEVTRNSALDALAHALEAVWNHHANPVSDELAVAGARRVLRWLPVALSGVDLPQAREQLALASLEAGLAFSQTRTALAHALSYPLTLERGVPHGLACAIWLPTAWRLAAGRCPRVDAALARVFDMPARRGVERLVHWLGSLGIDARPEAVLIDDAERRVAQAMSTERGMNFIAAPAL